MIKLKPTKFDAINSLVGGGLSGADDGTQMEYRGKTPPTKDAIDTKYASMISEWEAQEYARKREVEYPSIQECVHAILDNDNNELDTLQAKRAEIKLKYPKGG